MLPQPVFVDVKWLRAASATVCVRVTTRRGSGRSAYGRGCALSLELSRFRSRVCVVSERERGGVRGLLKRVLRGENP